MMTDRLAARADVLLATALERWCSVTCAVLVIDMVGFSRSAREEGIVAALPAIWRMQRRAKLIVKIAGGRTVKCWADNLMATFPDLASAEAAAKVIVSNGQVSAGVGYGRIIRLPWDLWGEEVNATSKLGEDEAGPGEVLLTLSAEAAKTTVTQA